MAGERRRGGLSVFLTGLRLSFNTPLRVLTRRLAETVECNGKRVSLAYAALTALVEGSSSCPLARRYSSVLGLVLKASAYYLGGRPDDVLEALRDPTVRRGLALVLEGLARYGVTVPQRLPAPFLAVWNFTNACNLRCKHCYQRADRPLPDELSLSEKLEVVRQLDEAGVAAIAFSGGEPTLSPDLIPVIKAASEAGIYTALATNGLMLADKRYAEKLKKAGLRYVEVSIDSSDPKRHDEFRGVDGAWERAVRGLRNAVELGFSTAIATTLTRLNADEVDDILDLAEEIGVQRVVFFNFVPVGRGEDIAALDLSPEEREELLRKLYLENERRRIEVYSTAPQYARVSVQMSSGQKVAATHFFSGEDVVASSLAEYIGGCGAGRIYAAVQPDGSVTPCVFMPQVVVGNLRARSFREIWEGSPVLAMLRNRELLKGPCGCCVFRSICGGCRARALAYMGDIMAPDPGCILNSEIWLSVIRSQIKVQPLIA